MWTSGTCRESAEAINAASCCVCHSSVLTDLQPWRTCFPYKSSKRTGVSESGLLVLRSTRFAVRKGPNARRIYCGKAFYPREHTLAGWVDHRDRDVPAWLESGQKLRWLPAWPKDRGSEVELLLSGRRSEGDRSWGASDHRPCAGRSRASWRNPWRGSSIPWRLPEHASRWFLGIPFVSVTANFRHIQQGLALDPSNDFTRKAPAAPQDAAAANELETLVSSS